MWPVLLLGIVLGLFRVFGVTHIAFQAAAHLYVGGLFGAWLMNLTSVDRKAVGKPVAWWLFILFLAMTVLETICFLAGPFKLNG